MAVHVLVFDPMNMSSIEEFEQQLDTYLTNGWEILHPFPAIALASPKACELFATPPECFRQSTKTMSSSC